MSEFCVLSEYCFWLFYTDDILNDGENSNSDAVDDKMDHPLREQDRFLPIANIAKIMKRTVPETGKVTFIF